MANKISSFPERLLYALKSKGISQQELSELTNINKGNMSRYINGIANPKMDKIELIAKVLKINGAWLMGYDVPMNEDNHQNELKETVMKKIDSLKNDDLEKLNILIDTMFN